MERERDSEGFRENLFLQREEEEGESRREELRQSFYFFLSFSGQHVFQFGDAIPLSLPNRAGKSLGSTANR